MININYDDYKYKNKDNSWDVYFKNSISADKAIKVYNGKFPLYISAFNGYESSVKSPVTEENNWFYESIAYDKNTILYKNVFINADIMYKCLSGCLKEYIVIKDDYNCSYQFIIDAPGLSIDDDTDGKLSFVDSNGKVIYQLLNMYMVDGNGKRSDSVKCTYEYINDLILITIMPDFHFLKSDNILFPVILDPSIMITGSSNTYDTCVDEQYPSSNYYLAESLWTGGKAGTNTMRTYIKFDLPSNILANNVTSAYIHIKKREHKQPTIKAYRVTNNWTSSTITWNNKPNYSTNNPTDTITLDTGLWYKITCTNMIKNWLASTYTNYGFLLKEPLETDSEQKTKYYSSDAPSPNKPELIINYNNSSGGSYYGSRPYQYATGPASNCMGYALEYKEYFDYNVLHWDFHSMDGCTKNQLVDYFATICDSWMNTHFGTSNFGRLSSYNSSINTGWYRAVVRVGYNDANANGVYDIGESWDYHWMYQTCDDNGIWAQKSGGYSSSKVSGTSNGANPCENTWYDAGTQVYNSKGVYYKIRDIRNISW